MRGFFYKIRSPGEFLFKYPNSPHQFKFRAIKIHMEQPKYNFIVLMRRTHTCVEAMRSPTVSLDFEYTLPPQKSLGKKKNYGNVVIFSECVSNTRHIFYALCLNTPYLIFFLKKYKMQIKITINKIECISIEWRKCCICTKWRSEDPREVGQRCVKTSKFLWPEEINSSMQNKLADEVCKMYGIAYLNKKNWNWNLNFLNDFLLWRCTSRTAGIQRYSRPEYCL